MFCKLIFLFTHWHRCNLRELCWIFCQFINVRYRSFFSLPWNVEISRPANSFCRSIIMKYYLEVLSINVRCRFYCKMQNRTCRTPQHAEQNRSKTNISKFRTSSIAAASFLLIFFLSFLSYFNLILNWLRLYLSRISAFTRATKKILSDRHTDVWIRCFQFSGVAT